MTEGSSLLAGMLRWLGATGRWRDERGVNLLDGGAHFYDSYETADGKYVAIGAIEPQFYALLLEKLGLAEDPDFGAQLDPTAWPGLAARLAGIFRTRTRDEWCTLLEGSDVCFAPVLSLAEAPRHPHNVARGAFVEVGGMVQPAPAPRYSATPNDPPLPPPAAGADNELLRGA
jgi:alpha-methylacyl-CoA racemase